jgi:hypothetical protein
MPREVSRRTSRAPEDKDRRTVRPDRVGRRGLDPKIVEDRPDPAPELEREADRGRAMDNYLHMFVPTEGKPKQ